ncbi:hypothetical protein AS594_39510 [Streptomyces agglomeratus]|uniref:Uncharacterized protein n=1 Tax=Streptomyces agglomeratus TaxID=285458 RepID=A0A1E5NZ76_9ACTN|nr:hypothetical protein AS594_39510 [Streptomyces agglomeratus]
MVVAQWIMPGAPQSHWRAVAAPSSIGCAALAKAALVKGGDDEGLRQTASAGEFSGAEVFDELAGFDILEARYVGYYTFDLSHGRMRRTDLRPTWSSGHVHMCALDPLLLGEHIDGVWGVGVPGGEQVGC